MKKVVISILHFNTPGETTKCLNSLSKIEKKGLDIETVVIDNASKEKYELPTQLGIKTTLLRNEKNLGFAGGHNMGLAYGIKKDADYILILNNDTIVDKDFLIILCEEIDQKHVGAVVPKIYFTKGHEYHKEKYSETDKGHVLWYAGGLIDWNNVISSHRGVDEVDKGQYDKIEPTEFATGACILFKNEVIKKTGGFDKRYFLYYEDGDLNLRIKKLGYIILFVPKSVIWHNNAGSSGSGSVLQDYYISRNRMLFGMTYAPLRSKIALIRESVRIVTAGRKWQRIGIRDFYLRKFGKGSFTPGAS